MKLKHKKLIDKSYWKYAHLFEICPKVPCLYYLMGIPALFYKIVGYTNIHFYKYPRLIFMKSHYNYYAFKIAQDSTGKEIIVTMILINGLDSKSYRYVFQ